jgi:hypothetical protein
MRTCLLQYRPAGPGRFLLLAALAVLAAAVGAWGLGEEAPAIALWSLPEHAELSAEEPTVGVVAYHLNGIEKVEFLHEGAVVAEASAETVHRATGEREFVASLAELGFAPGAAFRLAARVHPRAGQGRPADLVERTFHMADPGTRREWHVEPEQGDDEQGDGTAERPFRTVDRALKAARGGDHVLLHSGAYEVPLDRAYMFDRWVTLRPAPGAEPRIVQVGNPRCGMLKFEGLWFDARDRDIHAIFGAYSAPHYWFRNCRFSGTEGRFNNYTRALKFWGQSTHVTVEGCTFEYLDVAVAAPSDAILRGNTIRHMTSDAFNYNGRTVRFPRGWKVDGDAPGDVHGSRARGGFRIAAESRGRPGRRGGRGVEPGLCGRRRPRGVRAGSGGRRGSRPDHGPAHELSADPICRRPG